MLTLIVVAFASAVVLSVSVMLAAHKDYRSGFFGTLGLSLIALAAFARAISILTDAPNTEVSPIGVVFWIGMACFLGQLGVGFILRQRQRGPHWYDIKSPKRVDNDRKAA